MEMIKSLHFKAVLIVVYFALKEKTLHNRELGIGCNLKCLIIDFERLIM
jgi:hypothetical protein